MQHAFPGLARLKEGEAGQAVRLQEESKAVAHGAIPLAAAFNKAQPSSPAADHGEFDNDLRICVDSAFTKVGSISSPEVRLEFKERWHNIFVKKELGLASIRIYKGNLISQGGISCILAIRIRR